MQKISNNSLVFVLAEKQNNKNKHKKQTSNSNLKALLGIQKFRTTLSKV